MDHRFIISIAFLLLILIIVIDDCNGRKPFERLKRLKRKPFTKLRHTVKRNSAIYPGQGSSSADSNFNVELSKNIQVIQSALSNIRAGNVRNIRVRRDEKKKNLRSRKKGERKKKFKRLRRPKNAEPDPPPPPPPPDDSMSILENLKNIRKHSRNLCQKGLQMFSSAIKP